MCRKSGHLYLTRLPRSDAMESMRWSMRRLPTPLVVALGVATLTLTGSASADSGHRAWVGTWSAAVTGAATAPVPATVFENQTLRQIVHASVAGRSLRVQLSNEYGEQPLVVGEAHV